MRWGLGGGKPNRKWWAGRLPRVRVDDRVSRRSTGAVIHHDRRSNPPPYLLTLCCLLAHLSIRRSARCLPIPLGLSVSLSSLLLPSTTPSFSSCWLVSSYKARFKPFSSFNTTSLSRKRKASDTPDLLQPEDHPVEAHSSRPSKKPIRSAPLTKAALPATPVTQASTMESDDDFNSPVSSEEDFMMDDQDSDVSLGGGKSFQSNPLLNLTLLISRGRV
jgi:hypothetical protein